MTSADLRGNAKAMHDLWLLDPACHLCCVLAVPPYGYAPPRWIGSTLEVQTPTKTHSFPIELGLWTSRLTEIRESCFGSD